MGDAVEAYVAALAQALEAEERRKRRILEEVRGHLLDAADHYRGLGASRAEAERKAIADFGESSTVSEAFARFLKRSDQGEAAVVWLRDGKRGVPRMVEVEVAELVIQDTPQEYIDKARERGSDLAASLQEKLGGPVETSWKQMYQIRLRERGGERVLCIHVGPTEGFAIACGMQGVPFGRPMTHDFIKDLLDALGDVTVDRVVITKLEEETFYAQVEMIRGEHPLTVDCRPSDGIALAVRLGVPIFAGPDLTPHFIAA